MTFSSFKNEVTDKLFAYKYIYIYIYKQNLVLDSLLGLICHKIQSNQPTNSNNCNVIRFFF